MFNQIGFIGCGNMGSAIARAVCANFPAEKVSVANRSAEKAQALAEKLGCSFGTNTSLAAECDLIFLGVKPQMMAEMLSNIAPILQKRNDRFVLVTMAGGLTLQSILTMAKGDYPIIRIMPNTPVGVGAGVVQLCAQGTTAQELSDFKTLMSPAGLLDELPENLIDAASAVSGCGPAFVAMFLEAMADGGVACGLPRDKAIQYAAQTLAGVGRMAMISGDHPELLKDKVCSPAGSTIQGVRALEKGGMRSAVFEAVIAAFEKNKALGKV